MKKVIFTMFMVFLCTIVFAQSPESDFTINEAGIITRYEGWDTDIVIPSTIRGRAVTGIGSRAFEAMELTSVTIPNGVTSIGERAFLNNSFTSIIIPNSVVSIGDEAFRNNRLVSLTLSGNEVNIGSYAFANNSLSSVTVSGINAIIGQNAFANNAQLVSIILGSNHVLHPQSVPRVSSRNSSLFYDYVCNNRAAGTYTTNRAIGNEIREGDYSYYQTQYGAYVTNYHGSGGNRLIIPSELNGHPVRGISGLSGKSISRVQISSSVIYIADNAFANNPLTTVVIPEGVTYIGASAFENNNWWEDSDSLTSITIPASVTHIGSGAFSGNSLTSITIGSGVVLELPREVNWNSIPGSFGNGFDTAYNNNNREAGTYTLLGGNSGFWSTTGTPPAAEVTLGSRHNAVLQNDSHWYRVTVTVGVLTVFTEGSTDTIMWMYDSNMNQIGHNDDGGSGYNARISVNVAAGTYYIFIRQYSHGSGAYTLNVTR